MIIESINQQEPQQRHTMNEHEYQKTLNIITCQHCVWYSGSTSSCDAHGVLNIPPSSYPCGKFALGCYAENFGMTPEQCEEFNTRFNAENF